MSEEGTTCPACGKDDFESAHAMRQHYGQSKDDSHEGSLAYEIVECEFCGTEFKGEKCNNRRFCKEECMGKSKEGEDNPNWNENTPQYNNDIECPACGKSNFKTISGMRRHYAEKRDDKHEGSIAYETVECENCGIEITDHKYNNRKYCLECTRNQEHITEDSLDKISKAKRGENHHYCGIEPEEHPNYGVEWSEEVIEKMSKAKRGENNAFYGKSLSEEMRKNMSKVKMGEKNPMYGVTGEDHHSWKENTTTQYSELFYDNRPKALERDSYECRVCSMSRDVHKEEEGFDLHVHHITPRSDFMEPDMERPPDEAAEMSNLFTVCSICHPAVEKGVIPIPDNGNQMGAMDW